MADGKLHLGIPIRKCPFCCSSAIEADSNEDKESYPSIWFMRCQKCGAQGPAVACDDGEFGGQELVKQKYSEWARKKWNCEPDFPADWMGNAL